ncbi:MAG: hypothetical protein GY902_07880 [Planctomycetes bacterium]|nr:hypothetical protein [Planctomycetota bacterium]
MKISLVCSIALLMAAPLTAQSGHDPVKSAMNLLEKSRVEAAAGNLEAAAELAAKAQILLQESQDVQKQKRDIERVELELVRDQLVELETTLEGERHQLVLTGENPQVEITRDGLVMIQEEGGTGRLVELHVIDESGAPVTGALVSGAQASGCCGDCGDDCNDCESESSCEAEVECEITFAECEESAECEEIVCEESASCEGGEIALQWAVEGGDNGEYVMLAPNMQHEQVGAWMAGPQAPHAQHGDELHRELQALHMELQALRMELQALRMSMSMGMAHGNMGQMGHGQNSFGHSQMGHGGMGGMMMTLMQNRRMPQMRDVRMPQMRMRSMRLPQGQVHGMMSPNMGQLHGLMEDSQLHGLLQGNDLQQLVIDGEHQFVINGEMMDLSELGYLGDMGADMDFEFEFDNLHEGSFELHEVHGEEHGHNNDGHGHGDGNGHDTDIKWNVEKGDHGNAEIHTEMKVIINGKTYEGEEAKRKLEELGLGDMEKQVRVRVGKAGNTPLPPVPPTPPSPAKPHKHEEL